MMRPGEPGGISCEDGICGTSPRLSGFLSPTTWAQGLTSLVLGSLTSLTPKRNPTAQGNHGEVVASAESTRRSLLAASLEWIFFPS